MVTPLPGSYRCDIGARWIRWSLRVGQRRRTETCWTRTRCRLPGVPRLAVRRWPSSERMSDKYVYLDTSAFMKLITPEIESAALQRYLQRRSLRASSGLLRTEALRAAMRVSQPHVGKVRRLLKRVALIDVNRELLEHAGTLAPSDLRSLDAVHVAAALSLGDDLGDLVTYDDRMVMAAQAQGLNVVSPA